MDCHGVLCGGRDFGAITSGVCADAKEGCEGPGGEVLRSGTGVPESGLQGGLSDEMYVSHSLKETADAEKQVLCYTCAFWGKPTEEKR